MYFLHLTVDVQNIFPAYPPQCLHPSPLTLYSLIITRHPKPQIRLTKHKRQTRQTSLAADHGSASTGAASLPPNDIIHDAMGNKLDAGGPAATTGQDDIAQLFCGEYGTFVASFREANVLLEDGIQRSAPFQVANDAPRQPHVAVAIHKDLDRRSLQDLRRREHVRPLDYHHVGARHGREQGVEVVGFCSWFVSCRCCCCQGVRDAAEEEEEEEEGGLPGRSLSKDDEAVTLGSRGKSRWCRVATVNGAACRDSNVLFKAAATDFLPEAGPPAMAIMMGACGVVVGIAIDLVRVGGEVTKMSRVWSCHKDLHVNMNSGLRHRLYFASRDANSHKLSNSKARPRLHKFAPRCKSKML
jgi:hypothetical protein